MNAWVSFGNIGITTSCLKYPHKLCYYAKSIKSLDLFEVLSSLDQDQVPSLTSFCNIYIFNILAQNWNHRKYEKLNEKRITD